MTDQKWASAPAFPTGPCMGMSLRAYFVGQVLAGAGRKLIAVRNQHVAGRRSVDSDTGG